MFTGFNHSNGRGPRCVCIQGRAAEDDTRIHKVLDLRVNPIVGADPAPLRRGVASAWVSTLSPVSSAFTIIYFHCARDLM
jgi:hypothetical protein